MSNLPSHHIVPPMRNGVSASQVFLPDLPQLKTIYQFLCQQFPHISPQEWQQRFNEGLIVTATGKVLDIHQTYFCNQHIYYYRFLAHETHVPFEHNIIFENDHIIVVDKPHFLTMSPTGKYVQETLLVRLKKQTNNPALTPIHRLDRETAGIVLFSKQTTSRGVYQQLFAKREVTKTYHAIAPYHSHLQFPLNIAYRLVKGEPFYTMRVVDGLPNSETYIDILEHNHAFAKYLLKPSTGKQHQLRVHLCQLNIPIQNDPFYPLIKHKPEDDFNHPLQLLAKEICFIDPISQQKMQFSSKQELTLPLQCNDNE
ncbi:MAG: pseudouridine synthase [Acinetobacter sp.]